MNNAEVIKSSFMSRLHRRLQKLGPAMIPAIAVMPIAGLMQSIGIIFSLEGVVNTLPFLGTPFFSAITAILIQCGQFVMNNLHILFAVSVAAAFTKNDAIAALSTVLAFMTMNTSIGIIKGITDEMVANEWWMYAKVLGVNTLSMGVFGGIVCGLMVAWVFNRFQNIKLPMAISFFGGKRFVPIASVFFSILMAAGLSIFWPFVQNGLNALNSFMNESMTNTVLFMVIGIFIVQLLIPLGVHTIVWASMAYQFGTWVNSSGEVFHGLFPIHFAQVADGADLTVYAFISGGYPNNALLMALGAAIILCAFPKNRQKTVAEIAPGMLTGFVCGVTEPLIFSFIFSAFPLYLVHSILWAVVGEVLPFLIHFTVGTGAWGGIIDFILYGPMQGDSSWWRLIPAYIIIFMIATPLYCFVIKKLNLKTPGREIESDETEDEGNTIEISDTDKTADGMEKARKILAALGGEGNLVEYDSCLTRLRVSLKDIRKLDEKSLKKQGASGVLKMGNEAQVVFGTQANLIKSMIRAIIENRETDVKLSVMTEVNDSVREDVVIPATGELIPLKEVKDKVFSEGMVGCGFGVIPSEGVVVSPVNGKIATVFPTKHAVAIISDLGKEVLVHIGIDSNKLDGTPFDICVKEGELVSVGTELAKVNLDMLQSQNIDNTVIVTFTNISQYDVKLSRRGKVKSGEGNLIEFVKK